MIGPLSIKSKSILKKKILVIAGTIVFASFIICLTACLSLNLSSFRKERKIKIIESSNYIRTEKIFKNKYIDKEIYQGSTLEVFKKYCFGNQNSVPDMLIDVVTLNRDSFASAMKNELKITWLGHSSTVIELEGNIILIDPMFSERPSPISFIGPKRYHKSLPLKPGDFPKIDMVIISHDHYDHLDHDTIIKIHKKVKRFIVPLAVGVYLEEWGVDPHKITELDWMQNTIINGIKLIATPAQHYSGRSILNNYKTLWSSWVIIGKKHRVFYSGDSGYNNIIFRKIGKQFGPFDVALIECGQYHKGLLKIHMLPEQALQAHLDIKGKVMIPVHWGAFNLSIHDWYEPVERALEEALKHNIIVATPKIGQTYTYGKKIPVVRWWDKFKSKKVSSVYNITK